MCVCVCMYVVDSPKRRNEAMNTGRQSPSSFRQVSWFILLADRDTGHGTDGLTSPPKDSGWFIGAQSGLNTG